ncbi:uncharacterized protein LOC103180308 [Callorhinchus milii]|uniref:uncharacterized protein LOC103180308 n=1 Tax=Callorhinchus milii TaxID=7868 RepID=UPI00045732FC|nr:uncharacterized protein LOC103180308 [Callorhinchus milii]|eukprot:gi/632957070/ref/XP_007894278.1/ PREDICTED: cell wall integrity and stress response component 4-like [Callorhinchus milii]
MKFFLTITLLCLCDAEILPPCPPNSSASLDVDNTLFNLEISPNTLQANTTYNVSVKINNSSVSVYLAATVQDKATGKWNNSSLQCLEIDQLSNSSVSYTWLSPQSVADPVNIMATVRSNVSFQQLSQILKVPEVPIFQPTMHGTNTSTAIQPAMNGTNTSTTIQPAMNGTNTSTTIQPAMNGTNTSTTIQPAMNGTNTSTTIQPAMNGTNTSTTLLHGNSTMKATTANTISMVSTTTITTTSASGTFEPLGGFAITLLAAFVTGRRLLL